MNGGTILIVDDEPGITKALSRALQGHPDVRILTAQDAAGARRALAGAPVDVVLSDHAMPGEDGSELLAHVRVDYPEAVRVLITAHGDPATVAKAVKMGRIDRFIAKPWDDGVLQREMLEALDEASRRRQKLSLQKWVERSHEQMQRGQEAAARQRRQGGVSEPTPGDDAAQEQSVAFGLALLESVSPSLATHGRRVADLARSFAGHLKMTEASRTMIHRAALFHDLGQVVVGAEPSAPSESPRHPVEGALLAALLPALARVVGWIRHHHERYDGGGYPDALAEAAIPLGARILRIVDDFDVICFAEGHSRDEALLVLLEGAGTVYDPRLVQEFVGFVRGERSATPSASEVPGA